MEIEHKQKLLAVAETQKVLIWAVLAQLLLLPASFVLPEIASTLLTVAVFIFSLYAIFNMSRALGDKLAWLVTLATAVPYLGFIMLLIKNSHATKFLQTSEIKVALMGAKQADIDRLRQDVAVAAMPVPPQFQQR